MPSLEKPDSFSLTGARGTSLPNSSASHSVRLTSPPASRLDITQLVPVIQDLFTAGLAPSTQKAYKSGDDRYLKFCQGAKLKSYPTTEEELLLFVAHLHKAKLAWYNQVISGCNSLLSDCVWHGQPRNPFHAPGGTCAKGGKESNP